MLVADNSDSDTIYIHVPTVSGTTYNGVSVTAAAPFLIALAFSANTIHVDVEDETGHSLTAFISSIEFTQK